LTISKLAMELAAAISTRGAVFKEVNKRRSILLELSAMMLAVQYYETKGYEAIPLNLKAGRFVAKWWSRGNPRNCSWWSLARGDERIEAHLNAPVWDGHGGKTATFVVDVGITSQDAQTREDSEHRELRGFENIDLKTFIESKSLPIYPMLVAQFIGIAGEVTPWALTGSPPSGFEEGNHFDPTLVSRGGPSANTHRLLDGIFKRGIRIRVIPAFDRYVEEGRLTRGSSPSILAKSVDSIWPKVDWGASP
jgi:hypothetical protein